MGNLVIRKNFVDLNLDTMLPAIDEVIQGKYEQWPPQYKEIFRVKPSTKGIEQTTEVSGIGGFVVVPEGADGRYDSPVQGFKKNYIHAQYNLGFNVSKVARDDDQFGYIAKISRELGKSALDTNEETAASIFNLGFNPAYPGPDGKPLFAVDHPLVKSGGVQSNRSAIPMDLDVVSLQIALSSFRKTRDHSGKRIRIAPKKLVVHSDKEFIAAEILGGTERSDTANRAINSFRRRSGLPSFDSWMVWDYLSDPESWFLLAAPEDTELRWYDREKFNVVHDMHFDSRSLKTAAWMRNSCGFSSHYGTHGVPGQ